MNTVSPLQGITHNPKRPPMVMRDESNAQIVLETGEMSAMSMTMSDSLEGNKITLLASNSLLAVVGGVLNFQGINIKLSKSLSSFLLVRIFKTSSIF